MVQSWVGDRGAVTDLSAGHEPDLRIDYRDGRVGIGEVTTHKERNIEAMWAEAHKSGQPQMIDLPPGSGSWSAQLVAGSNIPRLIREASTLVLGVQGDELSQLTIYDHWPRGAVANMARNLGVEHLTLNPSGADDVLYYFMPAGGGSYGGDPDVITDWVEQLLAMEEYADITRKLVARTADERHAFLWADSATEFAPSHALTELAQALPKRGPQLDSGITHVWAISRFGPIPGYAALWDGSTWSAVPLPE